MIELLRLICEAREHALRVERLVAEFEDPQLLEHGVIAGLALRHLHERALELEYADDQSLVAELERDLATDVDEAAA